MTSPPRRAALYVRAAGLMLVLVFGAAAHADGSSHYQHRAVAHNNCAQIRDWNKAQLQPTGDVPGRLKLLPRHCIPIKDRPPRVGCARIRAWNAAQFDPGGGGRAALKLLPKHCVAIKNRPLHVWQDRDIDKLPKGWVCTNFEYYDKHGRIGVLCGPADQEWTSWSSRPTSYEAATGF